MLHKLSDVHRVIAAGFLVGSLLPLRVAAQDNRPPANISPGAVHQHWIQSQQVRQQDPSRVGPTNGIERPEEPTIEFENNPSPTLELKHNGHGDAVIEPKNELHQ